MAKLNCSVRGGTSGNAGMSHIVLWDLAGKGLASKIYLISPLASWSGQKLLGGRDEQTNIKKKIPKGLKAK